MAKTIQRSVHMDERVVMRATSFDIIQLKAAARANGTNVATLIRQTLIKQGFITPWCNRPIQSGSLNIAWTETFNQPTTNE